jgi:hypothetical protein
MIPYIICTNESCAEYLIQKDNSAGLVAAEVVCGTCGQPMADDDGSGVPVEERPNPEEPLVLPDPNA